MTPQIAILVAAYNAEQTLPRCLDSLCQQSLQDIEILCVDDCSTDDTPALEQRTSCCSQFGIEICHSSLCMYG